MNGTHTTKPQIPRVVWEFIAATNCGDLQWLETLFTERCLISACGYRAEGLPAVSRWMDAEVVTPALSLSLETVCCDGPTTLLRVHALEHGLVHRSEFAFRTAGRYIESLVITAVPVPATEE